MLVARSQETNYLEKQRWTAVASGACQRGLEGVSMVRKQITRRSYGVLSVRAVTGGPGAALNNNTFICPVTKELRMRNRVTWIIKKASLQASSTGQDKPKS